MIPKLKLCNFDLGKLIKRSIIININNSVILSLYIYNITLNLVSLGLNINVISHDAISRQIVGIV